MPDADAIPQLFYRRDASLSRRNELYLRILELGLHRIRGAAFQGDHRHCEIEADHLHNIPSYIAGGDVANHLYYLTKEIPLYLDRLDSSAPGNLDLERRYIRLWYIRLWKELETLVPVEGSPWEKEWRELKSSGWNYGKTDSTSP